ncbi:MAG: flagellar hook-basal body protein [Dehalococcoidia bacterium]|nr:flagellar hook-basal body protein [Dehalococcoidia bacterium]
MIKGLYSAFSAMESAWQYQDVLANNIANATTAGYKREVAAQQSFSDVLLSQQSGLVAPLPARIQSVVGQIGTGKFVAEFATDFANGAFQQTGQELDFALEGGFFAVENEAGELFYTRDGRFGRDANGDLVTNHGHYVLNDQGGHINLPAEQVTVLADGTITVGDGQFLDRLQVVDFTGGVIARSGEAYFTSTEPGTPIDGGVRQGYIEMSNSVLVEEMTTLIAVQRAYQANQTVLARLDGTLEQAAGQIGTFGV